jgi:small subunit ribosomal protein S4
MPAHVEMKGTRMSKRDSVKYKIDRRMGENIWGRPKSPVNKRPYPPGQHGQARKGKLSDFGIQLRAKQKLKGYYGNITEKQFRRTYDEATRQFVNHGHVLVNGKKVNIPSYRCKEGDVIEVREKSRTMALVLEALESPERDIPEYISLDPSAMKATFVRVPSFDEVPYPATMEPNLVVEFYSR